LTKAFLKNKEDTKKNWSLFWEKRP